MSELVEKMSEALTGTASPSSKQSEETGSLVAETRDHTLLSSAAKATSLEETTKAGSTKASPNENHAGNRLYVNVFHTYLLYSRKTLNFAL